MNEFFSAANNNAKSRRLQRFEEAKALLRRTMPVAGSPERVTTSRSGC